VDPCILLHIRKSPIHGLGLFAGSVIRDGTWILEYMGEKIPRAEGARRLAQYNAYIFHLNQRYDIDGKTRQNTARYINHSCAPNCRTARAGRTIWVVAAREIQIGEELTYNYGYQFNATANVPCCCNAPTCCGFILDPQYWERLE
jgi:uncharacterized protein